MKWNKVANIFAMLTLFSTQYNCKTVTKSNLSAEEKVPNSTFWCSDDNLYCYEKGYLYSYHDSYIWTGEALTLQKKDFPDNYNHYKNNICADNYLSDRFQLNFSDINTNMWRLPTFEEIATLHIPEEKPTPGKCYWPEHVQASFNRRKPLDHCPELWTRSVQNKSGTEYKKLAKFSYHKGAKGVLDNEIDGRHDPRYICRFQIKVTPFVSEEKYSNQNKGALMFLNKDTFLVPGLAPKKVSLYGDKCRDQYETFGISSRLLSKAEIEKLFSGCPQKANQWSSKGIAKLPNDFCKQNKFVTKDGIYDIYSKKIVDTSEASALYCGFEASFIGMHSSWSPNN